VPVELLGKSAEELRAFVASLGERPFRAAQLYHALYAERRFDFAAMTNIPAALRERLSQEARIMPPRIARRFPSVDGSIRYLFSIGGPFN
jgi:23S rRNA (adenine2503-C2)-methyltransferase